jgi:hypothetical protein
MGKPVHNRFISPTRRFGAGKSKKDLSIIILGGSMVYRMKSYGPKSLIKLSNQQTIIENQISVISLAYPDCEIILTTGFEADKIVKNRPQNIRLVENQLHESTNLLEEIRLALNNCVNDNVLIINGEMIFNLEAIDNITKDDISTVIIDSKGLMPDEEVGVTVVNDRVSIFSHGISPKWCNIVYLTGKELKFLKCIANDRDKNKLYLFEALNLVIDKRGGFRSSEPNNLQVNKIESSKDII